MNMKDHENLILILSHSVLAAVIIVFALMGMSRSTLALQRSMTDMAAEAAGLAEAEEETEPRSVSEEFDEGDEDEDDDDAEVRSRASGLKDGEYMGSGQGYGGQITMKLVVKGGTIVSLDIVNAVGETPAYLNMAKALIPRIIESGSANVDGVSGATYSSNGIKAASAEALKQAGGDGTVTLGKAAPKQKGKDGSKSKKKSYKKPEGGWKDGTYTGSAKGFGGTVSVKVTIRNGKISSISASGSKETSTYWKSAQAVKGRIIKAQNPRVDAVSGATYSSNGIINAVIAALNKAGKSAGPKDQVITTAEDDYVIDEGETAALGAKAKTKLSYRSSDSGIVKVDRKGRITGVSQGKAKITITAAKTKKYRKAVKKVLITVFEKDIDEPETPDTPDTPDEPDKPDTPDTPDDPDKPDTPDTPEDPDKPDTPDTPEDPDKPDKPDTPEDPDKPDTPDDPGEDKKSGTFTGSARGYGGQVNATVVIENGVITSITVEGKKETERYWFKAKKIVTKMVNAQTWDVDAVSGATYSSDGIRNAVKQALESAGLI